MVNEMNEKNLNDKLDFYMQEKIKVHIDLKDGIFLNGFIIKNSKENVWWMQEDKIGQVFVFVKDISRLEQYRGKEE